MTVAPELHEGGNCSYCCRTGVIKSCLLYNPLLYNIPINTAMHCIAWTAETCAHKDALSQATKTGGQQSELNCADAD